nr:MAG TPA: hypothetical protein [Caudoviricetes sp.]
MTIKSIAIAVAAGDLIIGAVSVLLFIIVLIIELFK